MPPERRPFGPDLSASDLFFFEKVALHFVGKRDGYWILIIRGYIVGLSNTNANSLTQGGVIISRLTRGSDWQIGRNTPSRRTRTGWAFSPYHPETQPGKLRFSFYCCALEDYVGESWSDARRWGDTCIRVFSQWMREQTATMLERCVVHVNTAETQNQGLGVSNKREWQATIENATIDAVAFVPADWS